jgi:hypothetical protein
MLDRKVMLVVSALVLAMLAAAIWLVAHGDWSIRPFLAPACVALVTAGLHWRLKGASGDRAAWAVWVTLLALSYAVICAGFQLVLVLIALKVIVPPALPWVRLFFALFGAQFLVFGNRIAKLPPLEVWRPAWLALGAAGEAAMLRFRGWLLVAYGLAMIAGAILLPSNLIAPTVVSLALASLIMVVIRRRQLKALA